MDEEGRQHRPTDEDDPLPAIRVKLSPGWETALADVARSWTKTLDISRAFSAEALRIQEIFKGLAPKIRLPVLPELTKPLVPDLSKIFDLPKFDRLVESFKPAFERLLEAWQRSLPSNWHALSARPVGEIVDIMGRTGLALAWVPRGEIVEELLAAADDERRFEIVLQREPDVLADLVSCLGEVRSSDLRQLREAAEEALATFKDGHLRAAQALAAAALTAAIEETLDVRLSEIRRKFAAEDPNRASIQRFRLVATFVALARETLSQFDRRRGDPIPDRFNRHASLHTVSPAQYTRRNALTSLMLLTSVLREFESRS